ncbi:ArsR family transcriptional regulator, partial [Acinetobacter baumannii]
TDSYRFYSPYISNMQRLENGNTLINEGSNGRIFEVTRDHDIVWEYISPFWGKTLNNNMVYRAYRIPYAWIPQLAQPQETPIAAVDVRT